MVEEIHTGHRIKAARQEAKISVAELADAAGVSVQAVYKWEKTGKISRDQLVAVAKKLHTTANALLGANPDVQSNAQLGPDNLRPFQLVPVVGRAKGGDNGFMDEEQYPVGHGNGYIEFPTRDPNAFGLLIAGMSMYPRYKHGEYAVVEPNAVYEVGDDVYVALNDGRKLVKTLAWERADAIQLDSLDASEKPLIFAKADVACIYAVSPAHKRHFRPSFK